MKQSYWVTVDGQIVSDPSSKFYAEAVKKALTRARGSSKGVQIMGGRKL